MTNLPLKILLINQPAYKGLIKLDTIIYADSILLSFELYNFKAQLTQILIESLDTYISNREFLKTLPIENVFKYEFDLILAEQYYQYLTNIYDSTSVNLITLDVSNLRLYLNSNQIFSILCYFQNYILGYNTLKLNINIFRENQIQKTVIKNTVLEYIPDIEVIQHPQVVIDSNIVVESDIIFLNDVLKLSPCNIITYTIAKYIQDLIKQELIDVIECIINKETNTSIISIQPLINFNNLKLSSGIYSFIELLQSFDFTIDEYISKIKTLLKALIYIVKNKQINEFKISIKCIETLIFIYSLKSDKNQINNILANEYNVSNFTLSHIVNSTIEFILNNYEEFQTSNVFKISFFHPLDSALIQNDINENEIRSILANELYLLDIDKIQFLQTVFDKITNIKKKGEVKLILNHNTIINIDKIILNNNNANKLLNYKILSISEKQFQNNKIITTEYYKILKIGTSIFQTNYSENETDLIISKYYSSIEGILKQISNVESNILLISTLNLLYHYIRPNIEATVQIELLILYRIVLPFIYDVFNINTFNDYFN